MMCFALGDDFMYNKLGLCEDDGFIPMNDCAELEIGLSAHGAGEYRVEMRFHAAGSAAEARLGQGLARFDGLGDAFLDADAYGRTLTRALFADAGLLAAFSQAYGSVLAQKQSLRLRLRLDAESANLQSLCWELLLNPLDDSLLSSGGKVLFSRFQGSSNLTSLELRPLERLRALAVVANPLGLERNHLTTIDEAGELRAVINALGLACATIPDGPGGRRATLDTIVEALRPGCDLLCLVCHGTIASGKAWLWLEGPDRAMQRVDVGELIGRLMDLDSLPALVVLVSCQSAGNAEGQARVALGPRLVEAGAGAVLAMQGNLSMETSAVFMPVFFRELRRHGSVDLAAATGRSSVRERPDWWMPVLFSRLQDNQLFAPSSPLAVNNLPRKLFEPQTVYIPAGPFLMGSAEGSGRPAWESPCHRVELGEYRIGRSPVTNREYAEFVRQTRRLANPEMGWQGQNPPPDRLEHAVEAVTWYDAQAYCEWLSAESGRKYRLPSEAEWEKAARGEDGRLYPWGDAWDAALVRAGVAESAPVESLAPQSVYGLYELVGSLRQWTCSLWGESSLRPDPRYCYPWAEDGRNELSASPLVRRVFRGGSRVDPPAVLVCSARGGAAPKMLGLPGKWHGFRVALSV